MDGGMKPGSIIKNGLLPDDVEFKAEDSADLKYCDADDFFERIGGFGRYQKVMTLIFNAMMAVISYQSFSMVFVGLDSYWTCSDSGLSSGECNITGNVLVGAGDELYNARCGMNRSAWMYVEEKGFSVITEFDLVCDMLPWNYAANSGFFLGIAVSALPMGWLLDRIGRKPLFFPCYAGMLISSFVTSFSPNIYMFAVFRLLAGSCYNGVMLPMVTLGAEIVGPKHRSLIIILPYLSWTMASCLMSLQAYLVQDWRLLSILLTAPYIIVLLAWRYVPESIRWLQIRRRHVEAENVLRLIANRNKKPFPECLKLSTVADSDNVGSFKDLIWPWKMATITLSQSVIWFCSGLVYYGVSLAASALGGNVYRDFVLISMVEIPSNFLAIYCADKLGRKSSALTSLTVAGGCLISLGFVPIDSTSTVFRAIRICLGMIAKLAAGLNWSILFVWVTEIYPTSVRAQSISLMNNIISILGATAAPWIGQWLMKFGMEVPFFVMGAVSFLAALCCWPCPETKDVATSEVINRAGTALPMEMEEQRF